MKKSLLFIVLALFVSALFADLEVNIPFDNPQVGQAWDGTNYNYQGEVFHVTNLGETATFSVQIYSTNIPENWNLVWCHEIGENQGCHSSNMPAWEFEFSQNATLDLDIQIINIDQAAGFDYYFEIESPSLSEPEIINFHFQTADAPSANDDLVNLNNNIVLKNYPNPFNPVGYGRGIGTTISFEIPKNIKEIPELSIYNILGQKIKTFANLSTINNKGTIIWKGRDRNNKVVSNGIYFYKLNINNSPVKKMILMK